MSFSNKINAGHDNDDYHYNSHTSNPRIGVPTRNPLDVAAGHEASFFASNRASPHPFDSSKSRDMGSYNNGTISTASTGNTSAITGTRTTSSPTTTTTTRMSHEEAKQMLYNVNNINGSSSSSSKSPTSSTSTGSRSKSSRSTMDNHLEAEKMLTAASSNYKNYNTTNASPHYTNRSDINGRALVVSPQQAKQMSQNLNNNRQNATTTTTTATASASSSRPLQSSVASHTEAKQMLYQVNLTTTNNNRRGNASNPIPITHDQAKADLANVHRIAATANLKRNEQQKQQQQQQQSLYDLEQKVVLHENCRLTHQDGDVALKLALEASMTCRPGAMVVTAQGQETMVSPPGRLRQLLSVRRTDNDNDDHHNAVLEAAVSPATAGNNQNNTPPNRHKCLLVYSILVTLLLLIGGGTVVGICLVQKQCSSANNENQNKNENTLITGGNEDSTHSPTMAPTAYDPDNRLEPYAQELGKVLGANYFDDNDNHDNDIRRQALRWLVYDDPEQLPLTITTTPTQKHRLLQRFVLVLLYFQTSQTNPWINCGHVTNSETETLGRADTCVYDVLIGDRYRWLTTFPECSWSFIECGGNGGKDNDNGAGDRDGDGYSAPQNDGDQITAITMDKNGLNGPLPAELGYLTRLTMLTLRGNFLTGTVSPMLGNLTSLQVLDLSRNQLGGTLAEQMFDNMTNLKRLVLNGNTFTGSIPKQLCHLNNVSRGGGYDDSTGGGGVLALEDRSMNDKNDDNNDGATGKTANTTPTTTRTGLDIIADCVPSSGGSVLECLKGCCTQCCRSITGECYTM